MKKIKEYQNKNYMEEVVFEMIDEILGDMNVCKCDKCVIDVSSKALNDLPPMYFVTEKGKLYSKMQLLKTQVEVDVISSIAKAAILVKRNPQH